jgi:hypothetical protein
MGSAEIKVKAINVREAECSSKKVRCTGNWIRLGESL